MSESLRDSAAAPRSIRKRAVALLPVQAAEHVHAEQRAASRLRQGDHAQPLGAHAALSVEVGAHDLAGDAAAGGARAHRALAAQAEPRRPAPPGSRRRWRRCRPGTRPRWPLIVARPVVVAVVAAPDLDRRRPRREKRRLLRLVLLPLVGEEDDAPSSSQTVANLSVRGRSSLIGLVRQAGAATFCSIAPKIARAVGRPSSRSGSCRRSA